MKWIKLVERESDFWKNYMMVSSLKDTDQVFGFYLKRHLTVREGFNFTHWMHQGALEDFGKQLEKRISYDEQFLNKILAHFEESKNKLVAINNEIHDRITPNSTEQELLGLLEKFCESYRDVYTTFHLSVYTHHIEKTIYTWLKRRLRNRTDYLNRYLSLLLSRNKKIKSKKLDSLRAPLHIKRIANFISEAAWIRLEGRTIFNQAHNLSKILFEEIGTRIGYSEADIKWLTTVEIRKLIKTKAYPHQLVRKRKKSAVLIFDQGKIIIRQGKAAQSIAKKELRIALPNKHTIQGMVAYPGKKIGRVRIIKTMEDIIRMKKGDILVTRMTTPPLLGAAMKATAIVTDEGGLTCHAAIIAREFKIPCIVGTSVATQILKNGDRIEVDARKGIINYL